jgi:hypothetical protein
MNLSMDLETEHFFLLQLEDGTYSTLQNDFCFLDGMLTHEASIQFTAILYFYFSFQ